MALQVDTYQMVDLILPEFELDRLHAAPGGGEAAALAGRNLNPFRRAAEAPVAFWSGIVDTGPQARTLNVDVPDYFNGRLRIMAVAVGDGAVGRAQRHSLVRGPFVITPNLLPAVAPGDEFDVTVGVANNLDPDAGETSVVLTAQTSEHLQLLGDARRELRIAPGREASAVFRVRAQSQLGAASVRLQATGGGETVQRTATLSVRPAVAYVSTVTSGRRDATPFSVQLERQLHDQLARTRVAASVSPLVLTDGLLSYLEAFPHACAEQIVSKVFPQIGLLKQGDAQLDDAKVREAFEQTIRTLRMRQTPQGGFLFWLTSAEPAAFPSVYITHFLTDAKDLGLPVPREMLASATDYLRQIAARKAEDLAQARLRAYAIYVVTRQGLVTTNYVTDLHEYLDANLGDDWRADLTAAYMAASYELLQKSGLGGRLIDGYAFGGGDEMVSDFDTRLGRDAQYLYLLARHFPARLQMLDPGVVEGLAEPIMRDRFNTLSSAYAVLALGEYSRAQAATGQSVPLELTDVTGDASRSLAGPARFARADLAGHTRTVEVSGAVAAPVFYTVAQTGFDIELPGAALAEGLEVSRVYLDAAGAEVTAAPIGAELTVRLRVRSTGRTRTNVAVVDLLPGGFEVLVDSVQDAQGGWRADYKDIREDRVVFYGSFADRITELRYRVKVTSSGDFVVPSAYAASMYDRSVRAHTEPGRFRVAALP